MKRLLVATLLVLIVAAGLPVTARELRVTEEEVYCLALNDYYEARGESVEGRLAVAHVVYNRLRQAQYGARTICEVVSYTANGRCAFSWACDRYPIRELRAWDESVSFARGFLRSGRWQPDPTDGAVQYHEQSITPYWAKDYEYNIAIGDHLFYPKQIARR
jgi:N-acetylmuramoyl-L-alanine amidase